MTRDNLNVLMVQAWDGGVIDYFISPPLGINRVRRWAEEELGQRVKITCYDPNAYTDGREKLHHLLERNAYDVLAFSPLHLTMENDLALMLDAHARNPDALCIVGGQQAAFAYELLFRYFKGLDAVVIGEGERPFTEILRKVFEHGATTVKQHPSLLHDIPGLYTKDAPDTKTGHNPAMSMEDFVKATFRLDFSDLDHRTYWGWIEQHYTPEQLAQSRWQKKVYTIKPYTTNYCPMDCAFCSTTQFYRSAGDGRARVVGLRGQTLEDYLTLILNNQPQARTVLFKDDLWFIRGAGGTEALKQDLAALKRVREKFAERDITYFAKSRVDSVVDPTTLEVDWELLRLAKEAGFFCLSFGVESFDVDELEYHNKRIGPRGPEVNARALEATVQAGIGTVAYLILSCPISTADSIFRTVDAAADFMVAGHTVKVNPFMFTLPGTTSAKQLAKRPDLCVESDFPVPGYDGVTIRRNVKVLPENKGAHELMAAYEEGIGEFEERMKEITGITHWISEISTPTKLLYLYHCAVGLGLRKEEDVVGKKHALESIITKFSGEHSTETAHATFA